MNRRNVLKSLGSLVTLPQLITSNVQNSLFKGASSLKLGASLFSPIERSILTDDASLLTEVLIRPKSFACKTLSQKSREIVFSKNISQDVTSEAFMSIINLNCCYRDSFGVTITGQFDNQILYTDPNFNTDFEGEYIADL